MSKSLSSLSKRAPTADVILVLGMHRSGTSAVGGTIVKLGGSEPRHLLPANEENPRGYFESSKLMEFHDELLTSAGSDWRDWRLFNPEWYNSAAATGYKQRAKELFDAEFGGSALPVLKDPRVCRFVPFWVDVLNEIGKTPRVVMPIRSPLEVAHSLSSRSWAVPHGVGLLLWLRHVLDAEVGSRSEARSIFTWEEFASNWRVTCNKIGEDLGISWPRLSDYVAREIDVFLTKDLIHHKTNHATLIAHPEVHEWTVQAYEALLELTRDPNASSALGTLDRIRTLFNQSSKMFGRAFVDYEVDLQNARGQASTLESERDSLRVRQDEILAEKAAVTAEFASRASEVERTFDEVVRERDELSRGLATITAERDALDQRRAVMVAEFDERYRVLESSHAATIQEKAAAVAEFAGRASEFERTLDEVVRERDELSRGLAAITAERDALDQKRAVMVAEFDERYRVLESSHAATIQEKAAAVAEFAGRASEFERTLDEAVRERDELSRGLAAITAERDALDRERAVMVAELDERYRVLESSHAATVRVLAEAAGEKEALNRRLATSLAEQDTLREERTSIAAELQWRDEELLQMSARTEKAENVVALNEVLRQRLFVSRGASMTELAAARRELSHVTHRHDEATKALQVAHSEKIRDLRAQLIDAEAATSLLTTFRRDAGGIARLLPPYFKRRLVERRLVGSGLLDAKWYSARYPDVVKSGLGPAEHYLEVGFCHGYRPNPLFDTRWYLDQYEDVRRSGVNPLLHYLVDGWREGRNPGPDFETDRYLEDNPDVRASGVNPLVHYLRHGGADLLSVPLL